MHIDNISVVDMMKGLAHWCGSHTQRSDNVFLASVNWSRTSCRM